MIVTFGCTLAPSDFLNSLQKYSRPLKAQYILLTFILYVYAGGGNGKLHSLLSRAILKEGNAGCRALSFSLVLERLISSNAGFMLMRKMAASLKT